MKIIIAGLPKTGTTSLAEALRLLGYTVYDLPEQIMYMGAKWHKIIQGEVADIPGALREMFVDIDSACDAPLCGYWREVFEAFPEAKVILSTRDSDEVWLSSLKKQLRAVSRLTNTCWLGIFTMFPTAKHAQSTMYTWTKCSTGIGYKTLREFPDPEAIDVDLAKYTYKQHNALVKRVILKDQLLEYNSREGWGPICKFLGVPEPTGPYPHSNKGGSNVDDLSNPVIRTFFIGKWVLTSGLILLILLVLYLIFQF